MLKYFSFFFLTVTASASPLYSLKLPSSERGFVNLASYKGKALLVVNTASNCGYTGQLAQIQDLYRTHKDDGFEVLAIPSNDFKQELSTDIEVSRFAKNKFGVTFPFASISNVRGANKIPLIEKLTSQKDQLNGDQGEIRWNFEKFLIDREGKLLARFRSNVSPDSKSFDEALKKALRK